MDELEAETPRWLSRVAIRHSQSTDALAVNKAVGGVAYNQCTHRALSLQNLMVGHGHGTSTCDQSAATAKVG